MGDGPGHLVRAWWRGAVDRAGRPSMGGRTSSPEDAARTHPGSWLAVPAAGARQRLRALAGHPASGAIGAVAAAIAPVIMLALPAVAHLPTTFSLGLWAPLPRFAVAMSYRYDGLSHLFAFLAVSAAVPGLVALGHRRQVNRLGAVLLLATLLAFFNYVMISDLVMLYIAWEVSGWLSWALIRGYLPSREISAHTTRAIVAHLFGYGLLAAVVLLVGVAGGVSGWFMPGGMPEGILLLLVLLPVAARAGLLPRQNWLVNAARLPSGVLAATLGGMVAISAPYLLARLWQQSGGQWATSGYATPMAYAVAAAIVCSLIARRARSIRRSIIYCAVADLAVVIVALLAGGPDALAAGLLLLVNNSLALAAILSVEVRLFQRRVTGSGIDRVRQVLAIAAAGSLIGVPPLPGFIARAQLAAALWAGGWHISLGVLVLATIIRTAAMARCLVAIRRYSSARAPAKPSASAVPATLGVAVPALLLITFGALPMLPQQFLIGPAVGAVAGLLAMPQPVDTLWSFVAALGNVLVVAVIGGAVFRPSFGTTLIRRLRGYAEGAIAASAPLSFLADLAADGVEAAGAAGAAAWRTVAEAAGVAAIFLESFVPRVEERYYLAAMMVVAIGATIAFAA